METQKYWLCVRALGFPCDIFTNFCLYFFSIFCFFLLLISGIGYIIGGTMRNAVGGWEWALRVTPGLGVCAVALMVIFLEEPVRGQSEGVATSGNTSSWTSDLKLLLKKYVLKKSVFCGTVSAHSLDALLKGIAFEEVPQTFISRCKALYPSA